MLRHLGREQQRANPDGMTHTAEAIGCPQGGSSWQFRVPEGSTHRLTTYGNGGGDSLPGACTRACIEHMHKNQPHTPDHRPNENHVQVCCVVFCL
jgi:hypothetical protein